MTLSLGKTRAKPSLMKESAGQAFETLFEEHWERIYGVIFRLVGEQAEAEDLALEVFWRFYQQPPQTGDPDRLHGWLYRVATNLGYNALRANRRRRHYELQAARLAAQDQVTLDPSAQAEQAAERQQVRQVLATMKPRAAKILVLRHAGLSYLEIARAIDVSPGSVGTLLARAEAAFTKKYRELEGR